MRGDVGREEYCNQRLGLGGGGIFAKRDATDVLSMDNVQGEYSWWKQV